jgi:hypothetical protein
MFQAAHHVLHTPLSAHAVVLLAKGRALPAYRSTVTSVPLQHHPGHHQARRDHAYTAETGSMYLIRNLHARVGATPGYELSDVTTA